MKYNKAKLLYYRTAQAASWVVSTFVFRKKTLRNEIKGKKGPFVVIANHQAALDFVNLIGATRRPMSFVISNSFYNTLPIQGFLNKMGVIPKQQFQTSVSDLKQIKAVIDSGEPVVIYPAGLMCEDGLSTPIPSATYKFLKWLNADVYVARCQGTYFVMPKWTKGMRAGRTYMDIYQLFSKEELAQLDLDAVQARTDEALLFDAYREQEQILAPYAKNDRIAGLENVLYQCPHCRQEFTMEVQGENTLRCRACGYAQTGDKFGFLHNDAGIGPELRYVSDWSRLIYEDLSRQIENGQQTQLTAATRLHMIDAKKHKFTEVGCGALTLSQDGFVFEGTLNGEQTTLSVPIAGLPTLPFRPGKYLELQHGATIYRCVLDDGKLAMKFINMVKIFYERNRPTREK